MDQWALIIEMYQGLAAHDQHAPAAQGMIDLVEHLRTLPDFAEVQAGLGGMALALGLPERKRRVHVTWERPYTYVVFLDFCEPAFYGERVMVEIEQVVATIRAYLDRVRGEDAE